MLIVKLASVWQRRNTFVPNAIPPKKWTKRLRNHPQLMRMSWRELISLHGANDWWHNDLWMNGRRFQHVSSETLIFPNDIVGVHEQKVDCWEQSWCFLTAVAQHTYMWHAYRNWWRRVFGHFKTVRLTSVVHNGVKHHILLVIQHERWFQVKYHKANKWMGKSHQFLGKKDQCHP